MIIFRKLYIYVMNLDEENIYYSVPIQRIFA